MFAFVRDLNALAVFSCQFDTALEGVQKALVQLSAAGGTMGLQAFAAQVVGRGAVVFFTGRQHSTLAFVFFSQAAQLVGHVRPGLTEGLATGGVRLFGGLLQRRAHLFDFADAGAHFNGQVDGEIPYVVGREIAKHDYCCPYGCLGIPKAR
ncbi:hypothetical protein D3C84_856100 [compost metagenome]